jgi:hypothetical protein
MQFKVISVLAFAMLAAALPTEEIVKRTDSQDAANKCSQGQTLKCCNNVLAGLIPVGVSCIDINCESSFQNPS